MYRVIDTFQLRMSSLITQVLTHVTLLLLLLLTAKPGQAGELKLDGSDGEWILTFTDPKPPASLVLKKDAKAVGGGDVVLTKAVTFTDLNPISIKFTQTKAAKVEDTDDKPEIFFRFREDRAENQTGTPWNDFHLELKPTEKSAGLNYKVTSKFHPAAPHFHALGVGGSDLKPEPLKFEKGADKASVPPSENTTESFIDLDKKNVVPNGGTQQIDNFVIHEHMLNPLRAEGGGLREFDFSEQPTPVPEPSAFLLFGSALAGIVLGRKRILRRT